MKRRYIAMQLVDPTTHWPKIPTPLTADSVWEPRNNNLYNFAGQAKGYSMQEITRDIGGGSKAIDKIDNGYVLMVDLDALPRVTFDSRGKPVGIAKDVEPTLLEQYEEAERMIEVWAKRADVLRNALRNP